jgi:glutathione peroxidase
MEYVILSPCKNHKTAMIIQSLLFHLLLLFTPAKQSMPATIYDFRVPALTGGTIDFAQFKGKKILIVNTASECGNTPQYANLETMSKKYAGKLVIVGFPANNFGAQEPGSNEQISGFCKKNYGVTFPMAAKISVKGADMAPIYHWLTEKEHNGYQNSTVTWNFQKYLLNEQGHLIGVYDPGMMPDSQEIIKAIEN